MPSSASQPGCRKKNKTHHPAASLSTARASHTRLKTIVVIIQNERFPRTINETRLFPVSRISLPIHTNKPQLFTFKKKKITPVLAHIKIVSGVFCIARRSFTAPCNWILRSCKLANGMHVKRINQIVAVAANKLHIKLPFLNARI